MRAIARASVMESQSIISKEKSFGDFVENTLLKSEGLIQTPTPPTRLLVGSALVPAAGGQLKNGQLAGTFSAPVGRGGSFVQGPFTGALHGSLRVPAHGSFVASPTQSVRELDDAQKEEMRKQFSDSVKQLMNGQAQANFVQRAQSAMAPVEKPTALMESSRLKMHLGNNNPMMVPVLQMQQGFGVMTSRQPTTAGDASQRGRSPLALANIAEGRAMSLSSKMPLMTNRGEPGVIRQSSKQ